MRSFIVVETSFEGLHCWPGAPQSESYLRELHRHLFVCKLRVGTKHTDREIEINAFKRWIDEVIEGMVKQASGVPAVPADCRVPSLGALSCEQIAEYLVTAVLEEYGEDRYVECVVLEDGILGAGVTTEGSSAD